MRSPRTELDAPNTAVVDLPAYVSLIDGARVQLRTLDQATTTRWSTC